MVYRTKVITLLLSLLLSALGCIALIQGVVHSTAEAATAPANEVANKKHTTPSAAHRDIYPDGLFKWTAADSIGVKYYGFQPGLWGDNPIEPSPDGRYFYVMSFRSELSSGDTVQTLEVFDTQQVRAWLAKRSVEGTKVPAPVHALEKRTQKQVAPIQEANWNETSTAIQFIEPDAAGVGQVHRLEVPSGKLQTLSNDPFRKFSLTLSQDVVLYQRWVPLTPPPEPPHGVMVPVPRNEAGDIKFSLGRPGAATLEWVASYRAGKFWVLPIVEMMPIAARVPMPGMAPVGYVSHLEAWFSPDGQRGVVALQDISRRPHRFVLVDFARQQVQPLSDVSAVGQSLSRFEAKKVPTAAQVFWTAEGKQAIVVNTALPAGQAPAAVQPVGAGYVAAYDVESGRWQMLEAMKELGASVRQARAVGWLKVGEELLVAHEANGQPIEGTVYARQGDRWVGRSVSPSQELPPAKKAGFPDGLTVTIRQSANDPPVLIAAEGGRERVLSKPDLALAGIWRARQEPFTWRMPDGTSVTGGLSLPRSAKKGTPVPLMIQACGDYRPDLFLPDGTVPSGFAHQALVAQGMAVLEMSSFGMPSESTPRERPDFVARLEAAVEALARQGTIDPKRVGLIGHSRTGHHALYAATHPGRVQLAAVEIWDSFTATYPGYLQQAIFDGGYFPSDYTRMNGGPSFWQNKAAWLDEEVLFNVDRVEAATLMVENGKVGMTDTGLSIPSLLTLGAFQLNRRPVEFLSVPEAGHFYSRARERKLAMDVTVDWMRFWLQGQEDPSAEKAGQYVRWRLIRQRNEERKSEQPRMPQVEGAGAH